MLENVSRFIDCGSIVRIDENRYLIGWGTRTWLKQVHDSPEPFFYFPDFFTQSSIPWFQHEKSAIVTDQEVIASLSLLSPSKADLFLWNNPHRQHFEETFVELQSWIHKGILKKAVPYVFEESEQRLNKVEILFALKKLLSYSKNYPLHVYGFWDQQEGILGASPEILFNYDPSGVVEVLACAGTKSHAEKHPFLKDPKEISEHQFVVQGIEESLAGLGIVKIGAMKELNLPTLSHLVTPIEVNAAAPIDFLSLVNVLHPTPALGAFPRKKGMEWLESYQKKMPRERYGAPLGYLLNRGTTGKCIAGIRNVQWSSKGSKIGAGCGIVKESLLKKEWDEICLKISTVKEMLSL